MRLILLTLVLLVGCHEADNSIGVLPPNPDKEINRCVQIYSEEECRQIQNK